MRKLVISAVTVLCLVMMLGSSIYAQRSFTFWSMWNEGEPQQQVLARAIKDFEAEYGVKVDVRWAGREVLSTVRPRLLAGENIDLVDQNAAELYGALVVNNIAGPMNDVLDMLVPGEDKTVGEVLKKQSYEGFFKEDGNLYVIPYNLISAGFWYDKDLWNDLGIAAPATWTEFLEACDVLKANGIDPIAFGLLTEVYRSYFPTEVAVRVLGAGALNAAAGDPTGELFKDPAWVTVGDILYQMSRKGKNLFMQGYEGSVYPAPQMDWIMGLAGMFFCGSWIPVETSPAAGPDFNYGCFIFPMIEGGQGNPTSVRIDPYGFNVLAGAENADLAKEFVAFFLKEEYCRAWVEETLNMTPRDGIPAPPELADLQAAIENAQSTHTDYDGVHADYPGWYLEVFLPLNAEILLGDITGAEYAEKLSTMTKDYWARQ